MFYLKKKKGGGFTGSQSDRDSYNVWTLFFQGLIVKKIYMLTLGTQETPQKGSHYAAICQYTDAKWGIEFHHQEVLPTVACHPNKAFFSTFWESLQNLTWQALLKWTSQKLGCCALSQIRCLFKQLWWYTRDQINTQMFITICYPWPIKSKSQMLGCRSHQHAGSYTHLYLLKVYCITMNAFTWHSRTLLFLSMGLMELVHVPQNFLKSFFPPNSSIWFCSLHLRRKIFLSHLFHLTLKIR